MRSGNAAASTQPACNAVSRPISSISRNGPIAMPNSVCRPFDRVGRHAFPQQLQRLAQIGKQEPIHQKPRPIADHDRHSADPSDVSRCGGNRFVARARTAHDLHQPPVTDGMEKVHSAESRRIGHVLGQSPDGNRRGVRGHDGMGRHVLPQLRIQLQFRRQRLDDRLQYEVAASSLCRVGGYAEQLGQERRL